MVMPMGYPRGILRLPLLFILLSSTTAMAADANITRYLSLDLASSCPGNLLLMNATASDGLPAPDVELRLVLYLPYQGLRAIQHTDKDGLASVELTKNGSYRVYISTDLYEHEKYVDFDYPRMCPPPPPKQMDITAEPDCEAMRLSITARANATGEPLEGVFILAGNWSSFSGKSGLVSVPFEKDFIFIRAERANYTGREFYFDARCLPPPECVSSSDCDGFEFCGPSGDCENVTGACGYPENHTWIQYGCCADADCGNESLFCENNTCMVKPLPPEPPILNLTNATNQANATNLTNATGNESGEAGEQAPRGVCAGTIILFSVFLFRICGQENWPCIPS